MESETEKVIPCMLAMQRYPWEQGVCAQALYEAGRDDLWIPMAYDAVKRQSEKRHSCRFPKESSQGRAPACRSA